MVTTVSGRWFAENFLERSWSTQKAGKEVERNICWPLGVDLRRSGLLSSVLLGGYILLTGTFLPYKVPQINSCFTFLETNSRPGQVQYLDLPDGL